MLLFLQRRGELLDKETLVKAVWPDVIVEENNLNQSISAVRRMLGDSRDEHRYIVTIPGVGYQFVGDVKVLTDEALRALRLAYGTPRERRSGAGTCCRISGAASVAGTGRPQPRPPCRPARIASSGWTR